jgi:archaellum component FlaC
MSLIAELEDMTLRMSPRFMNNITKALDNALEETTPPTIDHLKASVSDFVEAVKIMGLDELKSKLEQIEKILDEPGSMPDNLVRFKKELTSLADNIPAGDRESQKKKETPMSYMDVSVDRAVINDFTAIPGVNEERALALYFSGFTSTDDLKAASVAKLFGVSGMTLAVAKKIADHYNPDRLIRIQTLTKDEDAPPRGGLSFVGKPQPAREAEPITSDEVGPGEDPELLELFLEQLTDYIEGASTITQNLSSPGFSSEILVHLEEITQGLVKSARYMGYSHIQSMAERVEAMVKDVISGDDQLTKETLIFLNDSIRQLSLGCENLKEGVEKLKDSGEKSRDSAVSLEYNILTMAHFWGELHDLYKDTHNLLRRVSEQGGFLGEDIERLRKTTNRLDEMVGSIADLVESLE